MKTKCKGVILVLVLSMVFSLFVACQQTVTEPNPDPTETPQQPTEATNQSEEPVVIVYPNVDDGFSSQNKEVIEQVHDLILEKINIDLQPMFFPGEQFWNRLNTLIASEEQIDIIPRVSIPTAIEYYNDGIILDLTELINKLAPDYLAACQEIEILNKAREEAKFQGKDIVMPWPTYVSRANSLQIRTDWLETLNMNTPTTIEEFEAYLEAVKTKDPDGNNEDDTYGLSAGVWGANIVNIMSMFYCPSGWERWVDENGNLQPAELHPNYKLLLEDLARWYKAGYLPNGVFTSSDDQRNDWVINNKVGALCTWYSAPIQGILTLRETVPEANYMPINLIGKPEAANAMRNENATPNSPVITASSKNPEAAMKFLNWLYTSEGQILTCLGIENVSYKLVDGAPEHILGEDGNKVYYAVYNPQLNIPQLQYGLFAGADPATTLYREISQGLEKLPGYDPPDKLVAYDTKAFKSEAKIPDLNTFLDEQRLKVLVGERQVSEWDDIMLQWKAMGGDQYLEDVNLQYKAWLENNK